MKCPTVQIESTKRLKDNGDWLKFGVCKLGEQCVIQRNTHGHTQNMRAFPLCKILKTSISAWTCEKNTFYFLDQAEIPSSQQWASTTMNFDNNGLLSSWTNGSYAKIVVLNAKNVKADYEVRVMMPWPWISVRIRIINEPERNLSMTASLSGCTSLLCYPKL